MAIDLGNSMAKWAVEGHVEQRVSLKSAHWSDSLIGEALAAVGNRIPYWRVASVNRPITKMLVGRLQEQWPGSQVQTIESTDVPMTAKVANPDRVGIDRLLAAWESRRYAEGKSTIVIDAGSAITVDLTNAGGEFLGGVILPGVALQFDSLARGTDALPAIELPPASEISSDGLALPAKDTVSAIRSGILLGAAAAIDGLIQHYRQRTGQLDSVVVFTGGDGPLLARLTANRHFLVPRLVLDAIEHLPLSVQA